jgi:glutamine amidotransferase-like uncharacterized protein
MIKEIRVAILAEEPFFWGSRKHYHKMILDGYSWKIKNNSYEISTTFIFDKDIRKGKLTKSNFDILLVPGGGVGNNEALLKGFNSVRSVRIFKRNIADFIKQGGGYVGICGGAALITDLKKGDGRKPTSFVERQYNKSSLHISCVSSYFMDLAFPIFYLFQYKYPEKIGNSAYAFSFSPGETKDGKFIHTTGCPLDIQIYNDNPIFSGYVQKTERVRWWAGQALIIPEKPDRDIKVIARYPSCDVSENDITKIYAWRYKGGIIGILLAMIRSLKLIKKQKMSLRFLPLFCFYLSEKWERTDKIIKLNHANKPCITAEIYPNVNKGRILLSTVHTEYMIWWGGHITEQDDTTSNCIGKGLHKWKDIDQLSETLKDELTHNWWILRRFVAWTAKVPDSQLPPRELGKITKDVEHLIKKDIFWDHSIINQMKNI